MNTLLGVHAWTGRLQRSRWKPTSARSAYLVPLNFRKVRIPGTSVVPLVVPLVASEVS